MAPKPPRDDAAASGIDFHLGDGIRRSAATPYQRRRGEPIHRPLRIYAVDPSAPKLDGAVATIKVPYEPLEPGPAGSMFVVDNVDGEHGIPLRRAQLEDEHVLMADGYEPSPSDPRFHQQMVYAVCCSTYAAFRKALGRNIAWGFGGEHHPAKLTLSPHFAQQTNAWYVNDGHSGAIRFGYYPAPQRPTTLAMPGGYVFTCLSHDIIAHEVTHALLDGLRAHFAVPTGPDVPAFHEAFADLVAVFQHFSYREVVMLAIQRSRGSLEKADLLKDLARQFGHTTGAKGPLRSALEEDLEQPRLYPQDASSLEAHELGGILVSAVFEAFVTIFRRKTARLIRIATGGSGVLPPGNISYDLQGALADQASELAGQFLTVCVRAIDYCPPVGINYGDYLQAMITADFDVVPDDPWDYRGALIHAFWRRNIYPRFAANLSQDALIWNAPLKPLPPVPGLDFGELRFSGDPAQVADPAELRKQACALGRYIAARGDDELAGFGLVKNTDPRLDGDSVDAPSIESIRTARRTGPHGQVVFDLVAEVIQRRHVAARPGKPAFSYPGGCTVILGPAGEVRYLISKSVLGEGRLARRREFLASAAARTFWRVEGDAYVQRGSMFMLLHGARDAHAD